MLVGYILVATCILYYIIIYTSDPLVHVFNERNINFFYVFLDDVIVS